MEEPYLCCRVIYYSKQQDLITSKCDAETGNRILEMCSFIITNSVNTMNLLVHVESAAIPFIPQYKSTVHLLWWCPTTCYTCERTSRKWMLMQLNIYWTQRLKAYYQNRQPKSKIKRQESRSKKQARLEQEIQKYSRNKRWKRLKWRRPKYNEELSKKEGTQTDTSEGRLIGDRWTKSR